nr:MAG TPA: hypothetical protein [Bacteriophage sp.]
MVDFYISSVKAFSVNNTSSCGVVDASFSIRLPPKLSQR